MRKNKKYVLPLLVFMPLLMANAPAPEVHPAKYEDVTVTFVSKEEKDTEYGTHYLYSFNVTNTGDGYLSRVHASYENSYFYLDEYNNMFGDIVIAPGQTRTLVDESVSDKDISGSPSSFEAYANQEFIDDAFADNEISIREDHSGDYYRYYVSFNTDVNLKDRKYEFGVISEITYKGETIITHHELGSTSEYFLYGGYEELDLSDLTIKNIKMTRSDAYQSPIGTIFEVVGIVLLVCLGIILSGAIFVIVFFSVRKARRKKQLVKE